MVVSYRPLKLGTLSLRNWVQAVIRPPSPMKPAPDLKRYKGPLPHARPAVHAPGPPSSTAEAWRHVPVPSVAVVALVLPAPPSDFKGEPDPHPWPKPRSPTKAKTDDHGRHMMPIAANHVPSADAKITPASPAHVRVQSRNSESIRPRRQSTGEHRRKAPRSAYGLSPSLPREARDVLG